LETFMDAPLWRQEAMTDWEEQRATLQANITGIERRLRLLSPDSRDKRVCLIFHLSRVEKALRCHMEIHPQYQRWPNPPIGNRGKEVASFVKQ